jgi:hypothetical protein
MKKFLFILPVLFFFQNSIAEIIVFKDCNSENFSYEKNEYILNLNKGLMTRNFTYSEESYRKLRLNDLSAKKENTSSKGIIVDEDLIVSEITGYPAFYTQLIFNKSDKSIKIKTVLNNTEGVSLISRCKDIIQYKKQI